MGRSVKSGWDFGELFPPQSARTVLSVSEVTARVKRCLEREVGLVWVSGEISNFRAQASGHSYFTLKDAGAQLACVLFRGVADVDRGALADGRRVIVQGDLTVYEPRGQYQLVVRQVEIQGQGALHAAFERLKQKLQAEGLFAPERKRPVPAFPRRIGLVTSPTGAALRDVLHVIARRDPALELVLAPCRVQGEGAAGEIAGALAQLNAWSASEPERRLDLVLLTRGGGSLEDLWAFNEEPVARAVVASALPVISAIGHEIDFTISDFVADLRAATPSAAAELITEGVFSSRDFVQEAPALLAAAVRSRLERETERTLALVRRWQREHPRRRWEGHGQRLDEMAAALARSARMGLADFRVRFESVRGRLAPAPLRAAWHRRADRLAELTRRWAAAPADRLTRLRGRLEQAEAGLRMLSPLQVLERGYSMTYDGETGRLVQDGAEMAPGRRLRTRLRRGEVISVVTPDAERGMAPRTPGS